MTVCSKCGFESPTGMLFCGMCGTALSRPCPKCGYANPIPFKYCGMCGGLLAVPGVVTVLPVPTPVDAPPVLPVVEAVPLMTPPGEIQLEGERRVATVLLTDLTGSSALLEQMGTEAWVTLMNRILRVIETEIYRFDGHVDQFRGDGLLAFFGAVSAHEDDPERAVLAALSMQHRFSQYVDQHCTPDCHNLRLRVGISTGEIIVANLG
jgi:hypothetical protein